MARLFTTTYDKTGVRVALYYDLKFSGTIASVPWAVVTHWRATVDGTTPSEAVLCQALTQLGYDFWEDHVVYQTTGRTILTKLLATAFDDPTGFFEQSAALNGSVGGDICPPFVAKGFRQFRSNQNFRTSTHRFPEVKESNNVDGSWVFGDNVTFEKITEISDFLGLPHTVVVADAGDVTFQPVLLRTQYTTGTKENPPVVTTILNPPEISDVQNAAFYGISSQVSRKYIIPR